MPLHVEAALVAAIDEVAPCLRLLHVESPKIAARVRAGQFVLARCRDGDFPSYDPYLPRAFFVFAVDAAAGRMSLLVAERGRGSAWLSSRRIGQRVLLHGPSGREVRPARLTRHLLLLADGTVAVAGLALLASSAVQQGRSVTLVENVGSKHGGVPASLLPPDVEYRTVPSAAGGLLRALRPLLEWSDEVVIASGPDLLETLCTLRRSKLEPFTLHAGVPFQAIPLPDVADSPGVGGGGGDFLPCGSGVCGACAIATRRGWRLFCREGPAFPLEELRFPAAAERQDGGNYG